MPPQITTFLLHLRNHFTPWSMPTLPEVLISIKAQFPNDPGLTVIPGRNAELGTYRVTLTSATDDAIYLPLTVQGKNHNFLLEKIANQTTFSSARYPVYPLHLYTGPVGRCEQCSL